MKAGTGSWTEAEVGMCLEHGDCIKCGGNSGAEITFLDGSTIELQAGAEIEVVALNVYTESDSATIRVRQTIGRIIFRVTKIIDPASRYEVETPAGVVAIRGSAVEVYVTEDGTTWVCNLEGDIWAFAQGVELQVPEGRCCVIRPGQPPTLICDLTISSSTGGNVTTPGEGTFSYDEGTAVNMTAEAEQDYQFGSWSGDVGSIPSVNAATTTITMQDNYSVTANFEEDEVVTFPDPNLEAAVRQAISKPEGPLYASDLDGLTHLDAWAKNITDLTGLECATSLTHLNLRDNQIANITALANLTSLTWITLWSNEITDISPLANLTGLTYLNLSHNDITDISPLANLTSLTQLVLWSNQISTITALANLTSLTQLVLFSNQISTITALANLTNLTELGLHGNFISDISPLANLTSLTWLILDSNLISDISPLVSNDGLSNGDTVSLDSNPLSSESIDIYIPQLEARGVSLSY